MSDTVFTSQNNSVYHESKECTYLNNSTIRNIERETAKAWGMSKCQRCDDRKINNSWDHKCVQCGETRASHDLLITSMGGMCLDCYKNMNVEQKRARRNL